MEMTIDKGRGYVSAEKNKHPGQPIGVIPVDSIFTRRTGYRLFWKFGQTEASSLMKQSVWVRKY